MAARQPTADPEEVRRIIRLIESDPPIREEIRRALLTQELLEMPQRLAAFIEATDRRFRAIEERLDRVETDISGMKTDIGGMKVDIGGMKADIGGMKADIGGLQRDVDGIHITMGRMQTDIGDLKGASYERQVRERAPAVLSRVAGGIRGLRVLQTSDLADQLDDAVDAGTMTESERDEVLLADVVATGTVRSPGNPVYLVVEASVTAGESDVRRAVRRASLLARALRQEARAVVVTSTVPTHVPTAGVEVVRFSPGGQEAA